MGLDYKNAEIPSPNQIGVSVGGDNSGIITTGDGTVISAGTNAKIAVGYTNEKHEAILKSRGAQLRADLTRASTAKNR